MDDEHTSISALSLGVKTVLLFSRVEKLGRLWACFVVKLVSPSVELSSSVEVTTLSEDAMFGLGIPS